MLLSRSYRDTLEAARQQDTPLNSTDNRALDVQGLDFEGAMDKVQSHVEDTLGSDSGSGMSDLSALENETDDFGRLLLQHQRDTRRLNSATRDGQRAFAKARPHPRIAERLTREEREHDQDGAKLHERTSSGGSNDAEPPVHVPREWGRRARRQTDWLKKITAPSENGNDRAQETFRPSRAVTDNSDAEEQVQSIETTPPSMRRSRNSATPPSSLRHMNTTLRPLVDCEDQETDFTSDSFITSTPAQPRYLRKVDDLARREIEELENKAVTTRALDQIDQQSPNAVLRRTSSQRLRERAVTDGLLSPSMSPTIPPAKSRSPSRIPVRRQMGIGNKENVPVPSDGNGGSKGLQPNGQMHRTALPLAVKQSPQPTHQRADSMSLLRKLARVSSVSPSPGRERTEPEPLQHRKPDETKVNIDTCQAPPEVNKAVHDVDETPLPQDAPANAKTPVVTGAWVDTVISAEADPAFHPATTSHTDYLDTVKEEAMQDDARLPNPKSALDAIVREAKEQHGGQNYGESTIQSLEDIVHPNMDPTDTSMTLNLDGKADDYEEQDIDNGHSLTQAEKDRRQEQLAMESMNKHLRTARTSIKDANRGLRRVENRIETVRGPPAPVAAATVPIATTTTPRKHGHVHCDVCGGGYHSVWKALWNELRSCFYTWDYNNKYRIRFTWLGLACLLWLFWYFSESTLCAYYCHPLYVHGPYDGPDPNAPEFPFVIPTLLFRPLRWLWKPVCDALAEGLGVLFHALFSDSSTSADPPPVAIAVGRKPGGPLRRAVSHTAIMKSEWMASATTTGARVAQSVLDAVDEAGSMWDDEFLG